MRGQSLLLTLPIEQGWVTPWCKNYRAVQEGKIKPLTAAPQSHSGLPSTHTLFPLDPQLHLSSGSAPWPLLNCTLSMLCPTLSWFDSDSAQWTYLVTSGLLADTEYSHHYSALRGWDLPLPCSLPWLSSYLHLWRLCFLLEINTTTIWFAISTLKEKILVIQILAVFYWCAGQSVLKKKNKRVTSSVSEEETQYLFAVLNCKILIFHRPKIILNRTAFCQRQNGFSHGGKMTGKQFLCPLRTWAGFLMEYLYANHSGAGNQPWSFAGLRLQGT